MIDRKNFLIAVLSLSAGILTLGHLQLNSVAQAAGAGGVSEVEGDYQVVTGLTQRGDDGLYILDRRKNLVAMFSWDPNKRAIVPRDVRSVDAIMAGQQ